MDCNFCQDGAISVLTNIVAEACGFDLTQIQQIGVQKTQAEPTFTDETIKKLETWQTFLTATDETKIIFTPLIGGDPVIEAGDVITSGGGDNSTLNGVEQIDGVNPSNFSCVFKSLTPKQESQFKKLNCEKSLTVYLVLQGGLIVSVTTDVLNDTKDLSGLPIQSLFISDRNNAGFGTQDTHNFRFSLPAGWSENIVITKPEFNPFTAFVL